ncbi:Ubiquitin-protein ligase E3A-like protein [Emericellopsis cladophorae]|uniref:HECT-type E3 ubiquitin transferase n=1 Tax=Emericellopsis cladophorae TaxID=2686198 RepID=A0A9P9Y4Z5_9HYPO|nr:Ubiquitin-protein ligase E3A-like protein [Emericellopsis cladophorae]KAI6783612.1 Ubiquitin-protein ligase E3A-like protein [Emericellopsis cladophorae]
MASTPLKTRTRRNTSIDDRDIDIISGLWREAPFARLPPDAPPELKEYVTDVEDPRHVYIHQLRDGCGAPNCTVSTCFTCRKRLAGKAPTRKYSQQSARTLAVYLASQNDAESGLCPALRIPKEVSPSTHNNLIFEITARELPLATAKRAAADGSSTSKSSANPGGDFSTGARSRRSNSGPLPAHSLERACSDEDPRFQDGGDERSREVQDRFSYKIREQPASKDHRSFAANLFGTVAFRMIEWLSPQSITSMGEKLRVDHLMGEDESGETDDEEPSSGLGGSSTATSRSDPIADLRSPLKSPSLLNGELPEKLAPPESLNASPIDPTKSRRGPEALFPSPQSWKPRRRASLEPPSPTKTDEFRSPTKSPRPNGLFPEKLNRSLRSVSATVPRGVFDTPAKPAFFGRTTSPIPVLGDQGRTSTLSEDEEAEDEAEDDEDESPMPSPTKHKCIPIKTKLFDDPVAKDDSSAPAPLECLPPQSLKRLDADVVDFLCDVLDMDNTGEEPIDQRRDRVDELPRPSRGKTPLRRKHDTHNPVSRRQWRHFSEQAIFSVLSDPQALISSFSAHDDLFDSHTLWYCMSRLTGAVPSLVFHSLWMAADALFIPSTTLQQVGPSDTKLFRRNRRALSDHQAGCVMAICLHALAGSVPMVPDKHSLRALTWVRAKGLALSGNVDALAQPSQLRERFDDAFSNDLAIRLASRLCSALIARRKFATMLGMDRRNSAQDDSSVIDVLDPVFSQIDVSGLESTPALEFSEDARLFHHGRMQILILEWARAVLLHEWDGKADFATSGAFAGALTLIESMHGQKQSLQLLGRDFQMEYFSERFDSLTVPIAWLSFASTSQRGHMLDYPYLFTGNSLVSLFRAINFGRMSRAYEESSSLRTRMNAIVDKGSLITNPHHKTVLQDMLKTASRRYLVLEISREHVLRDAFDQLWRREHRELLCPLKVHLGEEGGEEGFDSGGVQQEFFRMAIAEFLHPQYGAFTVDDRTRMAWFAPGSVVELWKFELLGLIVSLAVYNGLTLPVTFPTALYRKLLNRPVTDLHHIEDGWPDLASGLTMLQDWNENDGAVEDVFARTYEFSVLTYGSHVTREMGPEDMAWPQVGKGFAPLEDGKEAPLVTKDNREDYVADYIRFLTDVSVRPQFSAFERGFRTCLHPKSLTLLNPKNLQALVEGVQEIDVAELRRCTRYVGWDASHRTIRDFWSIVKRYDEGMKRRLLEFVTASDRLPVGGVSNLQFIIQKNGEEDENGHLPTAYTCYGTLLLPEYKDKDALRERLAMALENAQGFGFA